MPVRFHFLNSVCVYATISLNSAVPMILRRFHFCVRDHSLTCDRIGESCKIMMMFSLLGIPLLHRWNTDRLFAIAFNSVSFLFYFAP